MFRSVGIAALFVWTAAGQSASFEVASVKAAAPCCAAGQWRESKALEDRIDFRYMSMKYCVAFAYRVKEYQVSGPAWLGDVRYDIVAKGAAGTRHDQLPEMMQQLLAERFKLEAHREKKEFEVLVLAVGQKGIKLKESPPDPDAGEGAKIGMSMSAGGVGKIEAKRAGMRSLANTLSRLVRRPVVDMTGLTGIYDFDLEYAPEDSNSIVMPTAVTDVGVSVYASVQRLGLKLKQQRPVLDAVVVDRAERVPVEN